MSYLITNQNNFGHIGYPCPSYPKATVKSGGCGACAVLNCVENTSSLRFDMGSWIDYVIKNRGRIDGGTDIAAIMRGLKRDYGFDYEGTNDLAKIKNHLKQGGMAVFHGGYGNVFSSAGHYVCLCGISDSGKAIVIDSGWYRGKYNKTSRRNKVHEWEQNGLLSASWQYVESDKKFKRNQGNNYYLVYAPKIDKETEDKEMIYKKIGDVPNWARPAVQLRVDLGVFDGTNTTESMARIWTVEDRMNPFYETLEDVPDYWRDETKALIEAGKIKGTGKYQVGKYQQELSAMIVAYR